MTIAACPPSSPIAPGVVVFDATEFVGVYPEFTGVSTPAATTAFNISTLIVQNCCRSVVFDPAVRQSLLYMLTAHYLYLFTPGAWNNNSAGNVVGRVSSASEGSVSASLDMPGVTLEAAWFMQTKYGAMFWQATALNRAMISVPSPFPDGAGIPGLGGFGSFGPRRGW